MGLRPAAAVSAKGRWQTRPRGAALLVFLLAVLVVAGAWLIGRTPPTNRMDRERISYDAMARAKEALLGYAASDDAFPGALPCPNSNVSNALVDGAKTSSGSSCQAYIGRLPWKTIGLGDLRDADGECLWYALSPIFRSALSTRTGGNSLNIATPGTISVIDGTGAPLTGVTNPVVAVIFSPGAALAGQDRTPTAGTGGSCGGNVVPANYLDTGPPPLNNNNATGNVAGTSYTFVQADQTGSFNDRIVVITAAELWQIASRRVAGEIRGATDYPNAGLRGYFATYGSLPYAATNPDDGVPTGGLVGSVPWSVLYRANFPVGLKDNGNGWYSSIKYTVNPALTSATLVIGGQTFTYSFP